MKYQISQEGTKLESSTLKVTRHFHLLKDILTRIVLELKQNKQETKTRKHFISTHKNTIIVKGSLKGKEKKILLSN